MSTVDTTVTVTGNSLKICACCGASTTTLCVNGACVMCHSQGLCHHE